MKYNAYIKKAISTAVLIFSITSIYSQNDTRTDSIFTNFESETQIRRHSIGSSFFLLGNLDTEEPPLYFQLNYGYHLSSEDVIVVEAITWAYYRPLGIQYWDSYEESYPGKIRSFGVGVGYQHFYWKGLYSTVQVTPFHQNFYDLDDKKIQSGFQLWCQFRVGYRFDFFNERWFLEPSIVCNYWPINTSFPESFQAIENNWPNYFLFEPGLHFGFKF